MAAAEGKVRVLGVESGGKMDEQCSYINFCDFGGEFVGNFELCSISF